MLLVESEGVRSGTGYRIPAHYTHERLGTMIGANRIAVTSAFGLLQDEGVVQLRRRLIYVTDIDALRRSAAYGAAQGGDSAEEEVHGAEPYRRPNRFLRAFHLSSSISSEARPSSAEALAARSPVGAPGHPYPVLRASPDHSSTCASIARQ